MTELVSLHRVSHHYTQASGAFGLGLRQIQTLIELDLAVERGSSTAVVGPSGSGKSTLLRIIGGLIIPSTGELRWGPDPTGRGLRRVQILFQDARASFDPKLSLSESLLEPLLAHHYANPEEVMKQRLIEVGLDESILRRALTELSGGEAQRLALARALSLEPELLLADEPTASLDDAARDELIALLRSLRATRGLALVLVTHDLSLALALADRVLVLSAGHIVEDLPSASFAGSARHEVSRRLLDARSLR